VHNLLKSIDDFLHMLVEAYVVVEALLDCERIDLKQRRATVHFHECSYQSIANAGKYPSKANNGTRC